MIWHMHTYYAYMYKTLVQHNIYMEITRRFARASAERRGLPTFLKFKNEYIRYCANIQVNSKVDIFVQSTRYKSQLTISLRI